MQAVARLAFLGSLRTFKMGQGKLYLSRVALSALDRQGKNSMC